MTRVVVAVARPLLAAMWCLVPLAAAPAQEEALWLRYPAIAPDGRTILFSYQGDIYAVPASGGTATPLTIGESYEFAPVWSHDGTRIAFASDRHGNFDVFVMPAAGGEATRLTFHSTAETPSSFSADDRAVLFSANRQMLASNVQFPSGLMSQLYAVPVTGGRVTQVLPVPALDATVDAAGGRIIYHDVKGYESPWRKHHTSAVTRDVWVYDVGTRAYRQLTSFAGEDRNPVFDADGDHFYYLTEERGSFNVARSSLSNPAERTAVTQFTRHPVRFLTRAGTGVLCFGWDGGIYTLAPGGQPQQVAVRIARDGRTTLARVVPVNDEFTEATLAPSGKEFAYVFRGEIFVSSMEGGLTKRITDTPWQERMVRFSPDGRSLVYAAERDSSWNVYRVAIARSDEPYFFASTVLEETPVVATSAEEYQPAFSPDGKEVAYLENRTTLRVANLASGRTRTILGPEHNYSYADGDQYYAWSPDGKWFLVEFAYPERIFAPQVGLIAADGTGAVRNLTQSGYDHVVPKWVLKGQAMIWGSDREGARAQGGGSVSGDVYALFFSRAAWDRFNLTKEELALVKEREEKAAKAEGDAKGKADSAPPAVVVDWEHLTERTRRLTVHTAPTEDWLLSADGEKLYYLTRFDRGLDLWVTEPRTRETKLFAKLGARSAGMEMSADGTFIFVLADGKVTKVATADGKAEPVRTSGEMVLKQDDERAYIFDHAWRQFEQKFYVEDLHGVDWGSYYQAYRRFLPSITNNYDFAEMLSEMLGEANASHTGARYNAVRPNTDETASLGLLYDVTHAGDGLRVAEVLVGGPLDQAASRIRAGTIIERIDGRALDGIDVAQLLNRKAGQRTLLAAYDPATKARWEETVKPIAGGAEGQLLYERWVRQRRAEVDSLSGGRIGYVHVRAMNDASMRTVFDEALGRNIQKDALIVDTRFNGGGNIHEQLSDFLSGKKYFDVIPHGQYVGSEPFDKWVKPSIVLMGEGNYSDAHLFPLAYTLKGVGKTLGMPVPGTGTFVWWERQIDPTIVFGIPMGGWRMPDGRFAENNQMEPDIRVRLDPAVMTAGRDQQIEAAVRELMGQR